MQPSLYYTLLCKKEVAKSFEIKEFLHRNLIPFEAFEIGQDPEAALLMQKYNLSCQKVPYLIKVDGTVIADPELFQIAQCIGLKQHPQQIHYDLAIIGAGPAGLTAAVYAGSEGLTTLLIERHSPGGRAGSTSCIENMLGFPDGLTGEDFTERSRAQAQKFGVEFLAPVEVSSIHQEGAEMRLLLSSGSSVLAKALIIATGVRYRLLEAAGVDRLTGAGIYYGTAKSEARRCRDKEVYIVGGSNSAGQAALFFSRFANQVHLVVRAASLTKRMSHYLVNEILVTPNITVMPNSEIMAVYGQCSLEAMEIRDVKSNTTRQLPAQNLFLLIGGEPHTQCLRDRVLVDPSGFILTGCELQGQAAFQQQWSIPRSPFALETSSPGILAIGDVRRGSTKRMAAAIGDGASAVTSVQDYLAYTF